MELKQGLRLGTYTLKERTQKDKRFVWICTCDCGKEKTIRESVLKKTTRINCSCPEGNIKLEEGEKIGYWTLKEKIKGNEGNNYVVHWVCQCVCNEIKEVAAERLKGGTSTSCGCMRDDSYKTRHGLAREPIYGVWKNMMDRCYNPKNQAYPNYGKEGIIVCDEWHNVEVFYKWALENGYKKGLENDRINSKGNYEPANCHFVPTKVNQNNRRDNIRIKYNGELKTRQEMSEILGIGLGGIDYRLKTGKLEKVNLYGKYDRPSRTKVWYEYNGDLKTRDEMAKVLNIHPDTLRKWEKKGKIKRIEQ